MWENQTGIVLLNGKKTAKYTKSTYTHITVTHNAQFRIGDNTEFEFSVNFSSSIKFGIHTNGVFIPIITTHNNSIVRAVLHVNKLKIYVNNKLNTNFILDDFMDSNICFSVQFLTGSNSTTILKSEINKSDSISILPISTNNTTHVAEKSISYLTEQNFEFNESDEILLVNDYFKSITLPELKKNKLLTIIKTYNDSGIERIPLEIKTVPPYSINDKDIVYIYYNNTLSLCGIYDLHKWFII
jgi:hypothetical protein